MYRSCVAKWTFLQDLAAQTGVSWRLRGRGRRDWVQSGEAFNPHIVALDVSDLRADVQTPVHWTLLIPVTETNWSKYFSPTGNHYSWCLALFLQDSANSAWLLTTSALFSVNKCWKKNIPWEWWLNCMTYVYTCIICWLYLLTENEFKNWIKGR